MKVPDRQSFTEALNEVRNITSKPTVQTENDLERTVFPRAFHRNIRRLSQRKGAGDILAFVLDSSRQFREAELCYVLACCKNPRTLKAVTHFDSVNLSEITQGLLTVGDDGLISFVHPGLRTYLQRNRSLPGFPSMSDKNSTLAHVCISYLSSKQFSDGPCASREDLMARISRSPFLDYAARHWHRHYLEADRSGTDMTLSKSAKQFLSQPGSVSSAWQILFLVRLLTKEHGQSQTEDSSSAATEELYAFQARFHATGLHLAVQLRLEDLAHVLATDLDPSIINRTDGNGQTPLHLAVALGAEVIAEDLLNHGGDANAKNLEGFSPWHIAAANGNLSMVRMFLKQPAERLHVNSQVSATDNQEQNPDGSSARVNLTMHGATSLHLAALNGHAEIVKSIIGDGRCRKLIEDRSGMTEFHQACKLGQLDVVKLLIDTSAKYVRQPSKKNGSIGFHLACRYASGYEVAKFLLEAHPDLCRITDSFGEVALHHAARGGVVKIVQLLLQQPDININALNKRDQTPLAIAAERENAAVCTLYDHDGAQQWMFVNGTPVAGIVRRQREKPTDI